MAATYPDVFAAGIAYSGVPAGCFSSAANRPAEWNSTCAQGRSVYTQQQWANVVKSAYPGYDGPRPKMQIYHGSVDEILNVQNHYETIKQWTGIFGYSTTATSTTPNYPRSPYTRSIFGDRFQVSCSDAVRPSTYSHFIRLSLALVSLTMSMCSPRKTSSGLVSWYDQDTHTFHCPYHLTSMRM
jgi:acetylxylan esterase